MISAGSEMKLPSIQHKIKSKAKNNNTYRNPVKKKKVSKIKKEKRRRFFKRNR